MNTDNFLIEENDIELAQNICKVIENSDIRNRAVADSLASKIAERFFDKENYYVDSVSGLHNIGQVLEDIDIADIYINNSYIDVRLYFNDEELGVPKAHFDNNLLPVAYMFIKVSPDLSGATVTGFIQPENIELTEAKDNFIAVDETQLVSFYDIEPLLITKEDAFDISETDIFAYLENNINDKYAFYKSLIASKDGRLRLAKAVKAQYAFNFVSISNQDDTLFPAEALETTDELLQEDALSDDFLSINEDNEIFEIGQSQEDMLLEDANIISENFDDNVDSSLESIEDFESTPVAELDIIDEFNLDDNVENVHNEELLEDDLSDEPSKTTSNFNPDVEEGRGEDGGFEFSTTTSPSLNSFGDNLNDLLNQNEEEDKFGNTVEETAPSQVRTNATDDVFDMSSNAEDTGETEDETPIIEGTLNDTTETSVLGDENEENNVEQIEALFNADESQEVMYQKPKQKSPVSLLAIIALLAIIGTVGYFGYNQFFNQNSSEEESNLLQETAQTSVPKKQEEAMPIESVETTTPKLDNNEGTAESIPAIEQNLDASILVSNLKVDWEVPAGYASNTSARRYLVKLGKIIQLNLKTELLLLNKPPITNKIAVEIKYNDSAKKFEAVGVTVSSGEQSVDNLIMQTVNKALAMNLSVNSDSFKNLQGNPVLIIHL